MSAACSLRHAKSPFLPVRLTFLGVAWHPQELLTFQTATKWPAQMLSFWPWSEGYLGKSCHNSSRFIHVFALFSTWNGCHGLFLRRAQELVNITIPSVHPHNRAFSPGHK